MKLISSLVHVALFLAASVSGLYSKGDGVVILTESNFQKSVISSKDLWMVEFYAPWCGHCKNLAPEWKKAAKAMEGVVKFGAIDLDQHKSVGGPYGIKGFPTIKFFGSNKNKPEDYQSGRDAKSMVDFALKKVSETVRGRMGGKKSSGGGSGGGSGGSSKGSGKKQVVTLTDKNFDKTVLKSDTIFFVEFYAPWCGHCKALAPAWESTAGELAKRDSEVKFAALDATVHQQTAGRYQVQGYPTLLIFGIDKSRPPTPYEGGRDADSLLAAALKYEEDNAKPAEIVELTKQQDFDQLCTKKQVLCLFVVFPHILDTGADGRNEYIEMLKFVAESNKGRPFRFLWTEVGAQPHFEKALDLEGAITPAAAAISFKKQKFSRFTRAFDGDHLSQFLQGLMSGKASVSPIRGDGKMKVTTVEPWDGKDGELPVEEDDYDDEDDEESTKEKDEL